MAEHFRFITYDSRGQGMSQRGLGDDHCSEDYDRDLEALVQRLKLSRFVLWGSNHFAHVAARFAVRHPEQVQALVLYNCNLAGKTSSTQLVAHLGDLAREDWDGFLHVMAITMWGGQTPDGESEYLRETTTQRDYLKYAEASMRSSIEEIAPLVEVPTLIIATPSSDHTFGTEESGKRLAALIPNSRLVFQERVGWPKGETSPLVSTIRTFLDEVSSRRPASVAALSPRELEVLRLLAVGRSNQQIADELVLSVNTVARHVGNILGKTGTANRTEAASFARDNGLL